MEIYIAYILENWPKILECVLYAFFYFLVILYRAKVNGTTETLKVLFKEKTKEITDGDATLRADMQRDLDEAKAKYNEAVNEIEDLKCRLIRAEKAIVELLADDVEVCSDGD